MSASCCDHGRGPAATGAAYRRILWIVLGINVLGFAVEAVAGVIGRSAALHADALDFLGDSANYAIALFVLARSVAWRAGSALIKGLVMLGFGLWVAGEAVYRAFVVDVPSAAVMASVGLFALAANVLSAFLLYRYREGDSNMRAVWLCSRNDAIGNVAVLVAAAFVGATATRWPDLAVAAVMAALAVTAAFQIIRHARSDLRAGAVAA